MIANMRREKNFKLDPRLMLDTHFIGKLSLCRVLLMNNQLFPWVILVPERENMVEIFDLTPKEQRILIDEITAVSQAVKETYWPDKINVAALGNMVEQLHVHIIARFKTDDCWPEPVWGKGSKPYEQPSAIEAAEKIRTACLKIKGFKTIANRP